MHKFDKTNKAIVYVENNIFNKNGIEALMLKRKPIIKVKLNVEGKDLEIPLYFKMVYDEATGSFTDQFKLTKTGSKMLAGDVGDPWIPEVTQHTQEERPPGDVGSDGQEDDIPF
jgi:hypothetical protein